MARNPNEHNRMVNPPMVRFGSKVPWVLCMGCLKRYTQLGINKHVTGGTCSAKYGPPRAEQEGDILKRGGADGPSS